MEPALIPVPFRNLVNCHADLVCNVHLLGVRPDGLLFEMGPKHLHLPLFLAHSVSLFPLLHVFFVLILSHGCQGLWILLSKGPLSGISLRILLLIVLAERHIAFHRRLHGCRFHAAKIADFASC